MGGDDEGGEVVGDRWVVRRGVNCVYCWGTVRTAQERPAAHLPAMMVEEQHRSAVQPQSRVHTHVIPFHSDHTYGKPLHSPNEPDSQNPHPAFTDTQHATSLENRYALGAQRLLHSRGVCRLTAVTHPSHSKFIDFGGGEPCVGDSVQLFDDHDDL